MKALRLACLLVVWTAAVPGSPADTFFPMVLSISPVAVQTGRTSVCEVRARYNLHGTYQVFVTGQGVTAEVDKPAAKKGAPKPQLDKLPVRFRVAADALPGVRDVRLATPQGVSTLGQLVVVRDPVVQEKEPNDTLQTAQAVPLPATICGALAKPEDVDYYKFRVAAGTALTFHVYCARLQDKIHDLQEHADPILRLRNAAGTVLAANDNYFFADPLLHYRFPAAGEYYLEIRDTRYGGDPSWEYCIEINDRPFVTNVHPLGVTPGTTARLHLVGHNLPPNPVASLAVPAAAAEGPQWAVLQLGPGRFTNPVPLVVSRLPAVGEAAGDNDTPARAQRIPVPCGISGCIDRPGDVDCYAFQARKGERLTFEVVARSHQSALDSYLRLLDERGQVLAENDDASDRFTRADSLIEGWTAPADGRYVVEIRDVHERGGPAFVYLLKVTRSEPAFTLETDSDKTLLAPGTAGVIFVRVTRHNGFAGEVQLAVDDLPAGVTAHCGRILAGGNDGCIILRAAPDARQGAVNIRVIGSASYREPGGQLRRLTAVARPLQEVYMPGGGRAHYPVEMHTVSVGDPLDLKAVRVRPTAVTLKAGEAKKVEVVIERRQGFKENVTLDVIYQHLDTVFGSSLPAGVTVDEKASQTLLTGEQTRGWITLKAAADAAPVRDQQVPVMAHVAVNFVVKFTYCGEPLHITVAK